MISDFLIMLCGLQMNSIFFSMIYTRGGSTGRGGAIIKIKFAGEISTGMLLECVMTAKMAEVSQLQPAFSRVCSGVL